MLQGQLGRDLLKTVFWRARHTEERPFPYLYSEIQGVPMSLEV